MRPRETSAKSSPCDHSNFNLRNLCNLWMAVVRHLTGDPAMIKLVYFLRRHPSYSRETFQRYWRREHAALIRRHAAAFGIARYVQLHAVPHGKNDPSPAFPEPFDGVAELWFRDEAGLAEWFDNRSEPARVAGQEIRADERRFIDRARSPLLVGREEPVIA